MEKTRNLKGVSGKTWSETWCFDGEVVVGCVVNVVFWMVCFWGSKDVTRFEIYFWARLVGATPGRRGEFRQKLPVGEADFSSPTGSFLALG